MTRTSQRAFRPAFDDLEGRQLLTLVGSVVAETSFSAPAITEFRTDLYMAWRGTDDHLNIEDLYTGHKTTLPDTTSAAPALATFNGRLVVAWTGTDAQHRLNVESSTDGKNFGNKGTLAQTTFASDGPALTAYRHFLVIAWTGTDTKLNDSLSTDARNFGAANTFGNYYGATSRYGPALATFHGDLNVAWTGTDNRLNILDLTTGNGSIVANDYSQNAPSLATAPNGDLYLAWTGTRGQALTGTNNQQLQYIDTVTQFGNYINQYSPYGPSLAYMLNGTRYFAWTGTDGFGPFGGDLNYDVV
jgi:hypothetical protein